MNKNNSIKNNHKKGFTLVELMIVITIIAVLATIGVASFTRIQKQARDTKRKGDLRTLATGLQAYFTEKQTYPTTAEGVAILLPNYVPVEPKDPQTKTSYKYTNDATNNAYSMCATLETPTVAANSTWKVSTKNTGGYEALAAEVTTCAAE